MKHFLIRCKCGEIIPVDSQKFINERWIDVKCRCSELFSLSLDTANTYHNNLISDVENGKYSELMVALCDQCIDKSIINLSSFDKTNGIVRCIRGHKIELSIYEITLIEKAIMDRKIAPSLIIKDNTSVLQSNVPNISPYTKIYIELGQGDNPVYYLEQLRETFPTTQIIIKDHDGSSIGQTDFVSVEAYVNKTYKVNSLPSYAQCEICKKKTSEE